MDDYDDFDDYEQGEFSFATEEHGAARATDPDTSHEAAGANMSRLNPQIAMALAEARTGLITHEIANRLGIGLQTVSPRMVVMERKKQVFDTLLGRIWKGAPGDPPTKKPSIVWQLESLRDVLIPITAETFVRSERRKHRRPRAEREA